MSNPLEAFGATFDPNAFKVLNFPSIIFLCGGLVPPAEGAESSLRALFYEHLKQHHPRLFGRVLLAEEANKWSKMPRHYDHLIDLEGDLAHLSAVIMLCVESAGSIAELGAFCNVPALRRKLVAVLEYSHQGEESFIQNGPVALMTKHDPRSVLFYPWLRPPDGQGVRHLDEAEARETIARLAERILEDTLKQPKEEKFDLEDKGHCMLLVADFAKLGSIVRIGEIESFLRGAGMSSVVPHVARYLFLLEQLGLVHKSQYSNNTYYVGAETPTEFIRYGVGGKRKTKDRMRLKFDLLEILRPLDQDRSRALDAYNKKVTGGRE